MVRPNPAALVLALICACGGPPPAGTGAGTESSPGATATTGASTTRPVPGDSSGETPTGSAGETLGGAGTSTTGDTTGNITRETPGDTLGATTGNTLGETGLDSSSGEPPAPVLTLQHVQIKGTHNSYHLEPALPLDSTHEYSHAPLADQLELQGVRAFELDVHEGFGELEVYHISVIDPESTCGALAGCLGQIGNWSDAHPLHLPIVVWIEIKDGTGGFPIDADDLDELDQTLRDALPPTRLFTPDALQAGHPSVREALAQDGWPALDAMRGRVLVVLLNVDDDHAEAYTEGYTTLAGRAMFARATPAQFGLPWAAIAKLGIDAADDIAAAHAARLLIATNVCSSGDSDELCSGRLTAASAAGFHMLKDDFPAKVDDMGYFLDLPGGDPARCNPVTAPPGCTSAALEDL